MLVHHSNIRNLCRFPSYRIHNLKRLWFTSSSFALVPKLAENSQRHLLVLPRLQFNLYQTTVKCRKHCVSCFSMQWAFFEHTKHGKPFLIKYICSLYISVQRKSLMRFPFFPLTKTCRCSFWGTWSSVGCWFWKEVSPFVCIIRTKFLLDCASASKFNCILRLPLCGGAIVEESDSWWCRNTETFC